MQSETPSVSTGPSSSSENAKLELREALELAAALAPRHLEQFYRWFLEMADSGRALPRQNRGPNLSRIAALSGIKARSVERYRSLVDEWFPRFEEAFGGSHPDQSGLPAEPPGLSPDGRPEPGEPDHELADAILLEMAGAPDGAKEVYEWLAAQARAGKALPMFGKTVNTSQVSRDMRTNGTRIYKCKDVLNRWAPFFPKYSRNRLQRRRRLPGDDREGVEVPTNILIRELEADLKTERDVDCRALLTHLIDIAKTDRTIPRCHTGAHLAKVRKDAGISSIGRTASSMRVINDWIDFFRLDDALTRASHDGTYARHRVPEDEIIAYVDELRARGEKLKRDKRVNSPSMAAITRALNLPQAGHRTGRARKAVMDYWKEAGPGEVHEGQGRAVLDQLAARRKDLLEYVAQCVADGVPLPQAAGTRRALDYDELVRRFGRPGPNLSTDKNFAARLARMNPKYARYHPTISAPLNYAQLISDFQAHRTKSTGSRNSGSSTRSAIKACIATVWLGWIGKDQHDEIGEDLSSPHFEAKVDEIIAAKACGAQPGNWKSLIRAARDWYQKRISDDFNGDQFDVILQNAVIKSGKSLAKLVEGTGITRGQLDAWAHGVCLPSPESRLALPRLAANLDLDPDRLVNAIDEGGHFRTVHRTDVRIPPRVGEFLPDNWHERDRDEVIAMVSWINENLVHTNTANGQLMRQIANARHAKKTKVLASAHEAPVTGEMEPAFGADRSSRISRYLDRELAPETTGLHARVTEELRLLRHHMTTDFPDEYLRRPGVIWQPESTAPMKISMMVHFFRWQATPEEDGGAGRDPADVTLADLLHPPLLFAYIDYRARKYEHVEHEGVARGKVFTGTEVELLLLAKSLLSREFGLVTQRYDLVRRLVADERPLAQGAFISLSGRLFTRQENKQEDEAKSGEVARNFEQVRKLPSVMPERLALLEQEEFASACRRAELAYASAHAHIDKEAVQVRDPAEQIQPILDTPQPMTTLLKQIALASRKVERWKAYPHKYNLAVRDLLLVRLLAITTLRVKNLGTITVDGPAPKLRYDETKGQWLLEISWREFKNHKNSALFGRRRKQQNYKKWLPDTKGLYDLLDIYVHQVRPALVAQGKKKAGKAGTQFHESDRLFLSRNGAKVDPEYIWRLVRDFTARHVAWNPFREEGVPMCRPFGPHAFRDIRATDILLNPETKNPYLEAAMALQTSPAMIQSHYGIIRTDRRTALDDISFLKREELAWRSIDEDG